MKQLIKNITTQHPCISYINVTGIADHTCRYGKKNVCAKKEIKR